MATKAHEVTWYIADNWETYYASAVLSGIVGDAAHQKNGGYHISIEDQSSTNYSVTRPDDKAPPGTWPRNLAAAIDMSMSAADMKLCSDRLWNVWYDQSDPRRIYLNGFNGYFNDGGPAKRYDYVTQQISEASSDHKWHVHKEIRRKWVTDMFAANAILSILRGETKQQYLDSLNGGDSDMYAKYGDGNNGQPRSRNVKTLQNKLLLLDPNCLPRYGPDGGYGDEVTAAFVRLVPGVGDGRNYDEVTIPLMDKEFARRFGPAAGAPALVQHTHNVESQSVFVAGSATGAAVPSA